MRKPRISLNVLYQSYGSKTGPFLPMPRAAVITGIEEGTDVVDLTVLNPTGMFFNTKVKYNKDGEPGTWRYVEDLYGSET